MRVVIDTCVMIAGTMGQTYEKQILNLVRMNKIEMIYSQDVLTEYLLAPTNFLLKANKNNKLSDRQIKHSAYKLSNSMSFFICNCAKHIVVKADGQYLEDKSDDKLINLAIDGNAKYIVSINCDLFEEVNVKNKNGESIVSISPYQFMRLFK
ncbi:putative toxin-antitoxin system toxin component, PIN family [Clostridium botulinum]|uniref:putative toxin-antitoxin system toxin component, PIN family n=1 Tax=Clostridium botulinum TaxID=1491 RepID=UPI0007749487|nr:putative toxin-antitoxin system toxin component, PIN family [Clostridium botulinum]QDY27174.1 putative toxin-antitoxin system toxin component, PIN family [Clostridium botulinum]